jgi:acrylyl-CoA reductase (NADPH)
VQNRTFLALVVDKAEEEQVHSSIREMEQDTLPEGQVLVEVAYSSLNYKDGLAVTGRGKVIRRYPLAPGIDLAGTVVESDSGDFQAGDEVLATGWGLGEVHWGGYAQLARLPAGWLTPLPAGLSLKQAMAIGTAGFTAMLAVSSLERHGLQPDQGDVAVTGATGGVSSLAVALLARLGYQIVASTGKAEAHDYLRNLGASKIIGRAELAEPPTRPLESGRWAGAIDVVGGSTLTSLLAALKPEASVAACGLAGGSELQTTVFPFILRGVNLLGINSGAVSAEKRVDLWARLAHDLSPDLLDGLTQVIPLAEVPAFADKIIDGQIRGRVVVDVNG